MTGVTGATGVAGQVEQALRTDGWAVVDLFSADEAARLRRLWDTAASGREVAWDGRGFFTSIHDPGWRTAAHDALADHRPRAAAVLDGYDVFVAAFMVKRPGATEITPHVDWSFADEHVHPTYNVWVATEAIDASTGALGVLPGSHRLVATPRGALDAQLDRAGELFEARADQARYLTLRPGQALVYDNRLIHFSKPNDGDDPRVVIGFALAHRDDCDAALARLVENLGLVGLA